MTTQDGGVEFSARELGILSSALAEVTYGFELENFEQQIGARAATVETLLERVNATNTPANHFLADNDVRIARNSLYETIRELGQEEFATRTGYDIDEAKNVLESVDRLIV